MNMDQYYRLLPGMGKIQQLSKSKQPRGRRPVIGSLVGLALGNALSIHGGTSGLRFGSWNGATAMALCLALSLIEKKDFDAEDQKGRYSLCNQQFRYVYDVTMNSSSALVRLAPVPCFFHRTPSIAVQLSAESARVTHPQPVTVDACRYYGALIVAALRGEQKDDILSKDFYQKHADWFNRSPLHEEISYIVGTLTNTNDESQLYGLNMRRIYNALKAALHVFQSTDTFEEGLRKASAGFNEPNIVAAIYGQLAGVFYGFGKIPVSWQEQLYSGEQIICVAEWIEYYGYKDFIKQNSCVSHIFGCARCQS